MKTFTETYVKLEESVVKDDGTVETSSRPLPEAKAQKAIAEANAEIAAGKRNAAQSPAPVITRAKTFQFYEVEAVGEILEIVPPEGEACNIFNRGLILKEQIAARDYIMDDEFDAGEGIFDLKGDCAELRERKKATTEDKAISALTKLMAGDPQALARILAQFQQAQQNVTS